MVETISFAACSVACTFLTSWLIRSKNIPPVRASSLVTVMVVSTVMLFDMNEGNKIAPVILGATFVGMTEPDRLRFRSLIIASIFFALFFLYILPFNPGFGGALGLAAFSSCILIYSMKKFLTKTAAK